MAKRSKRMNFEDQMKKRSWKYRYTAVAAAFLLVAGIGTWNRVTAEEAKHAAPAGHAAPAEHAAHPHWAYEGENGPAKWGEVSPDYSACKGHHQSPIDISGTTEEKLPAIAFSYHPSKGEILNNGHTIQVNYTKGSSIKLHGEDYQLLQFHFHDPSEHTIKGKAAAMELHLVHKNEKGELAVVGVLIEEGKENEVLKTAWKQMPAKADEKKILKSAINADELLPKKRGYYTYPGSLTTPPCSEIVTWLVLKNPIQMSKAQIAKFKSVINANSRPVQPVNDRKVLSAE